MQANSQAKSQTHEAPESGRREELVQAAALTAAAVWAVFWWVGTRHLWTQGGYLHLAFAQSLAADRGFGVQGRAVFGDASPLWVALLAGCHELLGPLAPGWVLAGKALTAAAAIFFAAGLYRFVQGLLAAAGNDVGTRCVLPALVVLVVVLSPYWGAAAFAGSEVPAAAGVACWGCALVAGPLTAPIRPGRLLAACLCAGCGPLLRPEMLFFSVCLSPFLFVRWVNTPLRFGLRTSLFFAGWLLAVGPGAGWLLYTVRRFGTALPNTVAAGAAPPGTSVLVQGAVRVGIGAPWLLVALAGLGVWLGVCVGRRYTGRRGGSAKGDAAMEAKGSVWAQLDPSAWLPIAWAVLAALYYVATRTAVTAREVLLLAPACTASVFAAVSLVRPRFARVAGTAGAVYGLAVSLVFVWPVIPAELQRERVYADLALTLRGMPVFERVALTPVGEVLFLSTDRVSNQVSERVVDRVTGRVVDLGGVLDPSAGAFRWDVTDARRVWWAHERGARLMVLDHSPEPGSTAVWSSTLPADSWENGYRKSGQGQTHTFDRLVLWRLPPSPTLPAPAALPGPAA